MFVFLPLPFGLKLNDFNDIRTAPFHPNIHNFGNVGLTGMIHALSATLATNIIDEFAYSGRPMRQELADMVASRRPGATVLDVGCGVGTLTRELIKSNLTVLAGIDTSKQMIQQAQREVTRQRFEVMNAVDVGDVFSDVDIAIACMVAHELPQKAHLELFEALLGVINDAGEVWIVDIHPSYTPSEIMLSGEPYVLDYLKTFEASISGYATQHNLKCDNFTLIDAHVKVYILEKAKFLC